ncbi:MAG TPA: CapA family protein [Gemmatimonadaceae bacterium]|jgi:poly-gamma-glutamate synthesis protein (capsule biosynthesis protein)|nr:CapA family protein [Gemmatimonadaceae bacterium]
MTVRSCRVVAVGDLQLGDSPTSVGFGFGSRYAKADLAPAFENLRPALGEGDIVFGNLEVPLASRSAATSTWASRQMRGAPRFAPALRSAGFTVLNVANNHAVQHGPDAFKESVASLRAAGITPCGVRGVAPWAAAPVTVVAAGVTVGILSYCLRPRQYGDGEPPYAEGTPDAIRADVARLRPDVESLIVSLHWGEEFVTTPSADETAFARSLIDGGVALVLGHHPHVARPIERYRRGLIAYSLGNCVGDMVWYEPFRRGLLLRAEIAGGTVTAAAARATRLGTSYHPVLEAGDVPFVDAGQFRALAADEYRREIARTWRAQRRAVYPYALARLWRVPPIALGELVGRTVRNKLKAAFGPTS